MSSHDHIDGGSARHIADDSFDSWFAARMNRNRNEERNVNIGGNISISDDKPAYPSFETRNAGSGIEVDRLFIYPKENAGNHNTEKYELVTEQGISVLRRSANFFLAINSKSRSIDLDGKDSVNLIFEFGKEANVPKGTKVVIPITTQKSRLDQSNFAKWDAVVYRQTGKSLILQVQISCGAPVGIWKCKVETSYQINPRFSSGAVNGHSSGTVTDRAIFTHPEPIYILFNPYSRHDAVYLHDERELREYVQNDSGKVWTGTYNNYSGRPWYFGQFEDSVLPACCFILQNSRLRGAERGNPIKVSRAISAMVNSVDDNGVLAGRWQKPYDDGTAPWEWTGSVKILEEYMENQGRKPVKYGQCWVFSALTVTICRALGIPCRSVTNYVSAHDTNHSLTVDRFFDEDGEEMKTSSDLYSLNLGTPERDMVALYDSIWNFHVWNDVWMARPDLPRGYGGWQAIDATPQEASDDVYRCGPSPLEAIRRGEVGVGFDTPFIFAEVNADVCHFVRDPSAPWGFKKSKLNEYHVGRLILTKSPGIRDEYGDRDAEDITYQYKNKEGTTAERLSVFNAVRGIDKAMRYYDYPTKEREDVHIELVDLEKVKYGDVFKGRVHLENKSNQPRTLNCRFTCNSIYYTGIIANLIKHAKGEFTLQAGEKETLAMTVHPEEYMGNLVDYCMLKINAVIKVKETKQSWSGEDDFVMDKPKLNIEINDRLTVGRFSKVTLKFTNPLDVPLTKCKVSLECSGTIWPSKDNVKDVGPKAGFYHTITVRPRKDTSSSGPKTFIAVFSSEEMVDVNGSLKVDIYK